MKLVPILGAAVIVGLLLQIYLGFSASGGAISQSIHVGIGLVGLAIAIAFVALAFRSKSATMASKVTMVVFLVLVLAQTYLGFSVMTGASRFTTFHTLTGIGVLVVALVAAGITARRRPSPPKPPM